MWNYWIAKVRYIGLYEAKVRRWKSIESFLSRETGSDSSILYILKYHYVISRVKLNQLPYLHEPSCTLVSLACCRFRLNLVENLLRNNNEDITSLQNYNCPHPIRLASGNDAYQTIERSPIETVIGIAWDTRDTFDFLISVFLRHVCVTSWTENTRSKMRSAIYTGIAKRNTNSRFLKLINILTNPKFLKKNQIPAHDILWRKFSNYTQVNFLGRNQAGNDERIRY